MKPLTLTRIHDVASPINMSFLNTDLVNNCSAAQIERMTIAMGSDALRVGDVFKVSGKSSLHLVIEDSTSKLEKIGQGWSRGSITVLGDAGAFAGRMMRGGEIHVEGSVGDYSGCAMSGGMILVRGSAGDWLGASLPGGKLGMNEGLIAVSGNAGSRLGNRMRRGLIAVNGDTGIGACSNMIGGTVLLLGNSASLPGAHMRRGTVVCASVPFLPQASFFEQQFVPSAFFSSLELFLKRRSLGIDMNQINQTAVRRFVGDLNIGGMGEILTP